MRDQAGNPLPRVLTRLKDFKDLLRFQADANDIDAAEILRKVNANELKVGRHAFYSTKLAGGKRDVKFAEPQDAMELGINNFQQGKPSRIQLMAVDTITVLAVNIGTPAPTNADMQTANYGLITSIAGAMNAEFTAKSKQQAIAVKLPLQFFDTTDLNHVQKGTFTLEVPQFIYPDSDLEITINSIVAFPANTVFKVLFGGLCTYAS